MQNEQVDFFSEQSEINNHVEFLTNEFAKHYANISQNPNVAEQDFQDAWEFLRSTALLHLYSSNVSLKKLYTLRAALANILLNKFDFVTEYSIPKKKKKTSSKYHFALYLQSIDRSTEARASFPILESLDKSLFHITLCTVYDSNSTFAQSLKKEADDLLILPTDPSEQVQTLRTKNFDVLMIGNNTTAVLNVPFILACHRIANVQIVHFCQPFSSYATHTDAFILGDNIELDAKNRYSEKIIRVSGSSIKFKKEEKLPAIYNDDSFRQELSISSDSCVLVSGSNLYKLSPLALDAFARILASAPHTKLILYPFGPAWSNNYPIDDFVRVLSQKLENQGVDLARCQLMKTLDSEEEVHRLLRNCDLYLDSFVHSGATSLLDPLSLGIPTISLEGDELRMAQGAGILKDMGLQDTIAKSVDHYVELAVSLAYDKDKRAKISEYIQANFPYAPVWDSRKYGQEISLALVQLIEEKD